MAPHINEDLVERGKTASQPNEVSKRSIQRAIGIVSVKNRRRLIWAIWSSGVIVASLLPGDTKQFTHTIGPLHRTVHMVAFAGIALGAWSWPRGSVMKLLASAGVAGLGALIELLQHYCYGNTYEWADVRDDGFGVLAGSLVTLVIGVFTKVVRRD